MDRKQILEAAIKCVCGDRDEQYGSPEKSFEAIADLWNAYLYHNKQNPDGLITARDVAAMMVLFKVARIATGTATEDSWVDAAGYAACGGGLEADNERT